jgi:hypothetical protein
MVDDTLVIVWYSMGSRWKKISTPSKNKFNSLRICSAPKKWARTLHIQPGYITPRLARKRIPKGLSRFFANTKKGAATKRPFLKFFQRCFRMFITVVYRMLPRIDTEMGEPTCYKTLSWDRPRSMTKKDCWWFSRHVRQTWGGSRWESKKWDPEKGRTG